jgi:hypothetical protein
MLPSAFIWMYAAKFLDTMNVRPSFGGCYENYRDFHEANS